MCRVTSPAADVAKISNAIVSDAGLNLRGPTCLFRVLSWASHPGVCKLRARALLTAAARRFSGAVGERFSAGDRSTSWPLPTILASHEDAYDYLVIFNRKEWKLRRARWPTEVRCDSTLRLCNDDIWISVAAQAASGA